jgi:anti-anti-sigma regulatory factor
METNTVKNIEGENGLEIEVNGEFSVGTCKDIRQQLELSLERSGHETLVLKNVTTMDVVAIQLTYAWKNALAKSGRKGTIVPPDEESIKDLLVKTGITQIL